MAKTFSFEEALEPAQPVAGPQVFSFEEAQGAAPLQTFSFEEASGIAPKEAGFTESFVSALKERAATAAPAAKLYFGMGDQAQAGKELLEARQQAADEYKQTEFSEIGDAVRKGEYGDALSKTYQKFKEVAGTSFGSMAPAMAAGAGAAFAAPAAVPATLAGTAAYGIVALGSYIADNLARQKEEQKKLGKEAEDVNRLSASVAATGQTALDIFGFKFFKPLGQLVGLEGRAAADAAALEIVEAATRPGAYRRAVATGAAKGIAFEVPQEVSQQVLERWQAGLNLNPFTDPGAAKEYLDAAGGALLLGGPMGATSRVLQTRAARKLAAEDEDVDALQAKIEEEQRAAGAVVPEAAAPLEEVANVPTPAEPVVSGAGPSVGVPNVGAPGVAGEVEASLASGLAAASELTGEPAAGAATEPVALTQPLPTYEQAQAVLDTLPNKAELQISEAEGGGYVIQARAPSVTAPAVPAATPAEMVGQPAPSPAVEPAASSVEPSAAPAVTEAVEAQPAAAPAEAVEEKPREYKTWQEYAADQVIEPEEEPSVAETTQAVEAKEERSEAEPSADAAATPTNIEQAANALAESTEQVKVNRKNPEAQQDQMRRNKNLTKLVTDAIADIERLSTPVTPEDLAAKGTPDERTIAVAEAANVRRLDQLKRNKLALFILSKRKDLTKPDGKPWKARQMAIDAVANFTPEERTEFEEVYAERAAAEGTPVLKVTRIAVLATAVPDNAFTGFTDTQEALRHILKVGNVFERLLASRLMSAVKGVKFVVVTPTTQIPNVVRRAMRDTTQGAYYQGVIYVHDASYGDSQGINNTVVLHEALHAATTKKLDYGLALTEQGLKQDLALQAFITAMRRAMNRAETIYLKAKSDGRTTPYLDGLHKNGAFSDLREFVSYGMTDKTMQSFLANIPGEVRNTSFFTKFVEAVRKLFGLGAQHESALQDLIVSTDAVLSYKLPPNAGLLISKPDTVLNAKKNGVKANQEAKEKLKNPVSSPEQSLTVLGQLRDMRSWDDFKDIVSDIYGGTAVQLRRPLLGALTTRQLTQLKEAQEMKDADGKPLLDNVLREMEDMNGAKTEMLDETANMAKEWHQWQQANPGKYRTLNRLIHLATINQIDPSVDPKKSPTLTQMYESLGDDGKALFNKIRDFYKARFMKYKQIMLDRISTSGADVDTQKILRQRLEDDFSKLPEPYFPLVREGKYWVRIGNPKSASMEYYMFEDPRERNFFVRQRAKELGIGLEELKGDPNQFAMGDNYMEAIDEGMRSSKMLKDVVQAVENATFTAATPEEGAKQKSQLRDQIYQLYFTTLPEQNFRKHFLHRKGTAGFRADALRNFAKSSFHTSVQLAKIEYGDRIRRALDRAWDVTKGMPMRQDTFGPIYDEMKDRIDAVLSPDPSNAFATRAANALGTASFVYYMSAPASAITNLTGLFVFGMPVLNGEFGPKANLALAKNMNIFKSVGVTDKDGKYTFPTLLSKLTGHRRDAFMEAMRRGKIDTTLTYDTLQLSRMPSDKYSGSTMTALNAIGYLFHHSEKINREVMFMSAYDLAYERAKKTGRDDKTAFEEAVNEASRMTDEAMFDYSEFNKPRFFRGNLARVVLQFKSFSQQTTFYLVKNFKEMFKGADKETKATAATKFIGTLGMTAMFAGALGLPLVSVLTWAMSLFSEDDEDPEKRNPKLRFRKWLREEFGENLGLAIERGPISWATDVDFHSRVKLDQLWFREIKQGKTEPEALKEFMLNLMGPSVGLGVNAAEALRRINTGDVARGVEMLLPAGLRGFAASYRQQGLPLTSGEGEGVRTLKDDKVVERNQLNEANRITTMVGFTPTKVAATQEDASQARAELDKVGKERTEVLTMFKDYVTKPSPGRRDAAIRALKEYNRKNPMNALDADTLLESIERNVEASATAVRGIRTTEKLRPLLMKLLPPDPYAKK